jgi:hypothetical protein
LISVKGAFQPQRPTGKIALPIDMMGCGLMDSILIPVRGIGIFFLSPF